MPALKSIHNQILSMKNHFSWLITHGKLTSIKKNIPLVLTYKLSQYFFDIKFQDWNTWLFVP